MRAYLLALGEELPRILAGCMPNTDPSRTELVAGRLRSEVFPSLCEGDHCAMEMWDKLEKDPDGSLSRSEFLNRFPECSEIILNKVIARAMDYGHFGTLGANAAVFGTLWRRGVLTTRHGLPGNQDNSEELDRDTSLEMLERDTSLQDSDLERIWKEFDTDGSGELSFEQHLRLVRTYLNSAIDWLPRTLQKAFPDPSGKRASFANPTFARQLVGEAVSGMNPVALGAEMWNTMSMRSDGRVTKGSFLVRFVPLCDEIARRLVVMSLRAGAADGRLQLTDAMQRVLIASAEDTDP
eukprot:NODE_1823_length_1058_cov_29.950446_g1486_i0.p1 GENE.NODE_1823_length_1058_cov_29.950446_g1486_i0~~NODE_1823_length_1058_cov_29.950446_g1486_i0.p1  ORF type:complete len:295 (-),score=76.04 NODE_1823_length_1058_cov_29.950446_g1486_i0:100-984(-)